MRSLLAIITAFFFANSFAYSQDWPQFLGPNARATTTQTVPLRWNEKENMKWKLDLPGEGSSSPIIVGDRIFITCASRDSNNVTRHLVCIDKKTGKQQWNKKFTVDYQEDGFNGYLREHGYASNTPVSDGKNVFVFFGKGGVYSFDLEGKQNWKSDVGRGSSNRRWGSAASLVLHKDSVIVNASEESQTLYSLNKSDGKVKWKQESNLLELAYGTPRLVTLDSGSQEIVISVPSEIWAINPSNGRLNWFSSSPMTGNVSPSVIVDKKTIFSFGGYRSSGSVAITAGGKKNVSKSNKKWTSRASSYVATPLLVKDQFYWIDDRGIAMSTNAKDGTQVYRERVKNLQGRPVYASPVLIGKHIYVVTRNAGTIVYQPGESFKEVARNQIAGDTTDFNASPAVSDGNLFLRSNKAIYCIGK